MECVKIRDYDTVRLHDFIETLLRNGYWVHVENAETMQERIDDVLIIYFEKDEREDY